MLLHPGRSCRGRGQKKAFSEPAHSAKRSELRPSNRFTPLMCLCFKQFQRALSVPDVSPCGLMYFFVASCKSRRGSPAGGEPQGLRSPALFACEGALAASAPPANISTASLVSVCAGVGEYDAGLLHLDILRKNYASPNVWSFPLPITLLHLIPASSAGKPCVAIYEFGHRFGLR